MILRAAIGQEGPGSERPGTNRSLAQIGGGRSSNGTTDALSSVILPLLGSGTCRFCPFNTCVTVLVTMLLSVTSMLPPLTSCFHVEVTSTCRMMRRIEEQKMIVIRVDSFVKRQQRQNN